jgi:hypothetical protein
MSDTQPIRNDAEVTRLALHACKLVTDFLNSLEGLLEDDPLLAVRRRIHAPLRQALNDALNAAEGCKINHFDIPDSETCPRCGKIVKRNELGREIDAPEQSVCVTCELRKTQWEASQAIVGRLYELTMNGWKSVSLNEQLPDGRTITDALFEAVGAEKPDEFCECGRKPNECKTADGGEEHGDR